MKGLSFGVVALIAAAGCQGAVDSGDGSSRDDGGASGAPAAASGGSPSVGGSAGAGNAPAIPPGPSQIALNCAAPKVGAPALRLLTRYEVDNTLNDIFPSLKGQWTSALPAGEVSSFGFDNKVSAPVSPQFAAALLETGLSVGSAVTGPALATLLPCSGAADRACAEQFITQYGRRLFRRPLSAEDKTRYLTYFDSALAKSDFKTAIKWVTAGLIQSPHAIYRSEIGTDSGGGKRTLSPHELATELAYTYTGSTPSEQLLSQADSGSISDPAAVARTLLATEGGKQALHRFFEGYLGYSRVAATQKPKAQGFSDVSADMLQETRRFIDSLVLQKGGGLKELLTAPSTNPSQKLATYYGLPAPTSDFASVQRPAGRGIGILAQAAFLATHANSDGSSPTQRGVFASHRLLCEPTPPLPDDIPQLAAPAPGVKTTRQRYEDMHVKAGGSCNTCHQRFDPLGFAFEHFDEGGRYRETEAGLAINSAASLMAANGTVLSFNGQEDLMTQLVGQSVVYECFTAYLATYAFGTAEACLGPSPAAPLQAGTVGIAEAYVRLAAEPHFTSRTSF